jgi:hypothetical protein
LNPKEFREEHRVENLVPSITMTAMSRANEGADTSGF